MTNFIKYSVLIDVKKNQSSSHHIRSELKNMNYC